MDKTAERRKHFKTPPIDSVRSQEVRRLQAFEDQKRKRTERFDAFRQLDQFSDLNLEDSDDEVEEDDGQSEKPIKSTDSVAHYTALLQPSEPGLPPDSRSPSPLIDHDAGENRFRAKKKRKGKGKKKPTKWANKCMYAELLEMREDNMWSESFAIGTSQQHDGLPDDLETSWVGLAPIPVGKRCLAVTTHSAGVSGIVPNTILRSRLLGKGIIRPFPSPLPPNTILDCILDENWRNNGILHVLDVIRWKSQDVADCEASFRFWWRDTRLAELPKWLPPAPHKSPLAESSTSSREPQPSYQFPYPITLAPVPFTMPLSFEVILEGLLARARQGNMVRVDLPALTETSASSALDVEEMDIDLSSGHPLPRTLWSPGHVKESDFPISSDGLLLYVGEAAYESGESPLSVWVPRLQYESSVHNEQATDGTRYHRSAGVTESPLDTFERLVRRRMIAKKGGIETGGSNVKPDRSIEVEMCS